MVREKLYLCGLMDQLLNGITLLIGNDYDRLFPLMIADVTGGHAKRNICRLSVTVVNDDVTGVNDNTLVNDEADVQVNLADDRQEQTNTQNNGVNDLLVCSYARQNESRTKAINDACVSAPDVCVNTSVGSSVNKVSNVLHGSNGVRKVYGVRQKSKELMNTSVDEKQTG